MTKQTRTAKSNPARSGKKKRQDKTKLKIIALGGLEEVGRNMMLIEYGPDILIIDMGLQFPEEDMPGIDYIIPDITYLKGKEKNIKGIIITHGHYDHIGGIPHLLPRLGMPPIY
ncbi:MBL fold metallo-hydrolase, partial [Patescibacteria group bacterium]|nr:MBL fold metallo-hydrolase [Patescibacteria group bacterium]